jgi:hypothetical protein
MIALCVLLLSLLWLAIVFAWIPSPGGPDSRLGDWIVLSIDGIVLVLAVVAVVLAIRGKYPWSMAIVFLLAPICHGIGYLAEGDFKIPFFALPLDAVILVMLIHYIRKWFRRSRAVT